MKLRMPPFLRAEDDEKVRRGARPEPGPIPGPSSEGDGSREDVRALQRAAGNRMVRRLLGRAPAPEAPRAEATDVSASAAVPAREAGRPLPMGVRRRMEGALGADLGDVRVHTDEGAASEVRRHGAEALAVGRHVAFERGRYRPGTLLGDALLAHELAHTVQQRAGASGGGLGAPGHRLEADANRSALGAVGALWGGAARAMGQAAAGAAPRLRSGTQMQFFFCEGEPTYEAPDYLGVHSRETLKNLNRRLGALKALGPVIAVGTAVTVGFGPPSDPSDTVEAAAHALRGLPAWARAIITEEVGYLYLSHGNDLNAQEREFWDAVLREVGGS
jgi:hypothetical protein